MKQLLKSLVSHESRQALKFDVVRLRTRIRHGFKRSVPSDHNRLHFGCGTRRVDGWLNVDLMNSDLDVDLSQRLPWQSGQFNAVVSQHVIEHLELHRELLPLLREVRRVCQPGAEIWLSTPDLAVICRSYETSKGADLLVDRVTRYPDWAGVMKGVPPSHMVNHLFHQMGQHKNLLDFDLLAWVLDQAGFVKCQRVNEQMLRDRFPEFPIRNDDWQSLYVRAETPSLQP